MRSIGAGGAGHSRWTAPELVATPRDVASQTSASQQTTPNTDSFRARRAAKAGMPGDNPDVASSGRSSKRPDRKGIYLFRTWQAVVHMEKCIGVFLVSILTANVKHGSI